MTRNPTSTLLLLAELESGFVVPERYSRTSVYGRCEPLFLTTALAVIAVVGSMLLCELTRDASDRPG